MWAIEGKECEQFGSADPRETGVLRSPAYAYAVLISFEMGKRKEKENENESEDEWV